MPLRDRLLVDLLKLLYSTGKGFTVYELAKATNVRWETVHRAIRELEERGLVESSRRSERFPFRIIVKLTEEGKKVAKELSLEKRSKLGLGERLLLTIIWAVGGEVKGTTKLEKLPFLLEREYGVPLKDFYKYFAYLHGPYSPEVIKASIILAYYNFINIREEVYPSKVEGEKELILRVYELTEEGKDFAKELFENLPDDVKAKMINLKRFAQMTTKELLNYVYTKYPEFKKYTTLDRFF